MQQTQQYEMNTAGISYGYAGEYKKEIEQKRYKRLGYRFVKRGFDIAASLAGLLVLSPVFLLTALVIYLDDPGPVLFFQERNGQDGKVFKIWKFRSMVLNAPEQRFELEEKNELDGPAFKIKRDPRVTRVGRFLRRTSIDELPQLVNILRGEMSVVGPRPLPTYETEQLSGEQRKRMQVKPGLTCYWQILGRSDTSFEEWMEYDFQYIREQGIRTDLKILLHTIPAVIRGRGGVLGRQLSAGGCSLYKDYNRQKEQYFLNIKTVIAGSSLSPADFAIRGAPFMKEV